MQYSEDSLESIVRRMCAMEFTRNQAEMIIAMVQGRTRLPDVEVIPWGSGIPFVEVPPNPKASCLKFWVQDKLYDAIWYFMIDGMTRGTVRLACIPGGCLAIVDGMTCNWETEQDAKADVELRVELSEMRAVRN